MEPTLDAPVLVNCTYEDVRVLVNGEPVLLPRGIVPELVHAPGRPSQIAVQIPASSDPIGRVVGVAEMRVYDSDDPVGVLSLPPYVPGVWCLVEPDAIREFPWRTDFVTPAVWQYVDIEHGKPDDSLSGDVVLVGVTRAPEATASEDMRVLDWDTVN